MFDGLITQMVNRASMVGQRAEGVAFFTATKDLYLLASVTYFCANLPLPARAKNYAHCVYSDTCVKQFMSQSPLHLDFANEGELRADAIRCESQDDTQPLPAGEQDIGAEKPHALAVSLRERFGETAILGITAEMEPAEWRKHQKMIGRECRILANYFHSHVLRINGYDSEGDILMSARELDCLRWTAAGKTAWEASIILGISERTVRFHLNAAREKLSCATTTQAVAKAIVNQLINV
jgi:DNA-binding CsgD family transcriptional regulator